MKMETKMKKKTETAVVQSQGERVAFIQDGMPSLEIWLEEETLWMTQKQLAALFDCAVENVIHHIANIYKEEELEESATTKDYLAVRLEGKRQVSRRVKHYNLDMAISVGYRVNSIRGVRFRQWATKVLKEYLLRGSVRDRRIEKLEKRMTAAERSIDALVDILTPALPENRTPIGFNT